MIPEQEMILNSSGIFYYLPLLFFAMGTDLRNMTNMSYKTSLLTNDISHLATTPGGSEASGFRGSWSGGAVLCNNTCASAVGSFLSSPNLFFSIHGFNEKISVQAYENQVKFIFEFIQNADTELERASHQHEL